MAYSSLRSQLLMRYTTIHISILKLDALNLNTFGIKIAINICQDGKKNWHMGRRIRSKIDVKCHVLCLSPNLKDL